MVEDFPAELEQFIAQQIESVAQMETLFLLRQDPERPWDCADLAKQLYLSADMCAGIVAELERRGLAQRAPKGDNLFQFRPVDAETGQLLDKLATLYQQRRVAVITQIYSKPARKVQTLADAFRLRKEE